MTKRVVLIGHPVSHSLSGAMQQAAFDSLGIDARYELWDRPPIGLADAIAELRSNEFLGRERHDPPQGTGRAARRPADRGCPRHRRGQHDHPRGQAPGRPQHRRARLQAGPRQARRPPEDAPPGGRPRRGRRQPGGGPRPDHEPASCGSSCSTGTSIGRRTWSSSSARAPPTWSSRRCPGTSRSSRPSWPRPGSWSTPPRSGSTATSRPIPGEIIPADLLVLDLIYRRTRLLRDAAANGATVADGETMLLHQGAAAFTPVDRPAGSARGDGGRAREGAGRGDRVGRGRTDRRRSGRLDGAAPLPDRRRIARAGPGSDDRGRARRARPDRGRDRGRPRSTPARLRPRRPPGDRARPGRDPGRGPPRPDARLADPAPRSQPRLGELDPGDAGRAAERGRGRRAGRGGRSGQQAGDAGDPGPARPRRPGRCPEVRLQRRARRARAGIRPRDGCPGRRRRRGPGLPFRARDRASGRSPPRLAASPSTRPGRPARGTRRTPRRCAARTPRRRPG